MVRIRDFLKVGDADIYYEVTGSGPAIVFAHGLSGNHLSWWQQVPFFASDFTCVTFAQRGFPPSKEDVNSRGPIAFGDDLAALIEHLNLPEVFLVAQSMGGFACIEYTFEHPEKVQGLVLASTVGNLDDETLEYPGLEEANKWFEQTTLTKQRLAEEGIEAAAGFRMATEQPALHYLYREIDVFTTKEFKAKIGPALAKNPSRSLKGLAEFDIPVLFITGEEDSVYPPIWSEAAASVIPNSEFVKVVQAGHSVYFERADIFNKLVKKFLTRLQIQ